MRTKDEILTDIRMNINKAPVEGRPMLEHEYCYIEVLIDIRDVMASMDVRLTEIANTLHKP